jgi:hypothetical protein
MNYISIRAFFDMEISDTEVAVVWSVFLLQPEVPVSILVSSESQHGRGEGFQPTCTVFDLQRKNE